MEILSALGPGGVFALLVIALVHKGKNKSFRRKLNRAVFRLRLELWARSYGVPIPLARKLQRDRWNKLMEQRRFSGLRLKRIKKTPVGVCLRLGLEGSLTFKQISYRTDQLETALGLVSGTARLKQTRHADGAELHIVLRDPLKGGPLWAPRTGRRRLRDPLRLSLTPFGEVVTIDMRNRIGVFGTSGSGKSTVQRNMGAHVIESEDAELEVWDLKHGLESQHFEGKAHRVTTASQAVARTTWLLEKEFPRRAQIMKARSTSSWDETPEDPARVVMIDEGNVLVRELTDKELKRFFTAVEQGRALGIYFVWATQFPKSSNLPTELRSQLNIRICLRLESSEETRIVFKDESSEGWDAHKLQDHWLFVRSSKHRTPEESKAFFLSEEVFRSVRPLRPVQDTPVDTPQTGGLPENLRPWVVSGARPVSLDKSPDTLELTVQLSGTDKVLSVLKSASGPMGVREIGREADMNPGSVQRVLSRADTVRQTPDKKYVWTG